jgi:hypothetical protein
MRGDVCPDGVYIPAQPSGVLAWTPLSRDGVINASVSHTHTLSYTVTTSCRPHDDVVSVISSFVPELSSLQTAELVFNATVRAQGEAGLDATWNDVFKGEYKRLAAAVTGNLTESRGTLTAIWTCWAASSAEARRQVGRRHVPSSMRPHVFEAWTRCPSVSRPRSATPEQCPRCSRAPSAGAQLLGSNPLPADEGTTIFLFCAPHSGPRRVN